MTSTSMTGLSTVISKGCGANSVPSTPNSRQLRRSMALATVFRRNKQPGSGLMSRLSLTARILFVNIFALVVLAGGFFYLDSYRTQLVEERRDRLATEANMAAEALAATPSHEWPALLSHLGEANESRLRVYRDASSPPLNGWQLSGATYTLRDPADEP